MDGSVSSYIPNSTNNEVRICIAENTYTDDIILIQMLELYILDQ